MGTPIINPWWFYIINVVSNLQIMLVLLSICFFGASFIIFIVNESAKDNGDIDDNKYAKNNKIAIKFIIIFCIVTPLSVLVPSKETCYKMMAAQLITSENIAKIGDTAINITDYIVESVEKIMDKED